MDSTEAGDVLLTSFSATAGVPYSGRRTAGCQSKMEGAMIAFVRALTYAAVFLSAALLILPDALLDFTGLARRPAVGLPQVLGAAIVVIGCTIVVTCVLAFAFVGRGTPAPFDPPRRLVVSGPYRWVRNPMYIGAGLALGGLTAWYQSAVLLGVTALFCAVTHMFIVLYEEPFLRRTFGSDYEAYCQRVSRWWPARSRPA